MSSEQMKNRISVRLGQTSTLGFASHNDQHGLMTNLLCDTAEIFVSYTTRTHGSSVALLTLWVIGGNRSCMCIWHSSVHSKLTAGCRLNQMRFCRGPLLRVRHPFHNYQQVLTYHVSIVCNLRERILRNEHTFSISLMSKCRSHRRETFSSHVLLRD